MRIDFAGIDLVGVDLVAPNPIINFYDVGMRKPYIIYCMVGNFRGVLLSICYFRDGFGSHENFHPQNLMATKARMRITA